MDSDRFMPTLERSEGRIDRRALYAVGFVRFTKGALTVISVKVTSNFNASNLEREVMRGIMERLGRVRTVTCSVHRKSFPVSVRGESLGVSGELCCEDGVKKALNAAVAGALR